MDEVAVCLWRGAFDGRLAYGTDPIITLKEPDMSNAEMQREAYTSALMRLRTADLFPFVQPGQALFPLMAVSEGRYCSMGGGAPLTSEGQLVAGVGVSGGTVAQDVNILESALRETVRPALTATS